MFAQQVRAAHDALVASHANATEVVAIHMDVCREWARVVALAQRCTAVFNCVDVGMYHMALHLHCARSMRPRPHVDPNAPQATRMTWR
jgi:hypothetical protein